MRRWCSHVDAVPGGRPEGRAEADEFVAGAADSSPELLDERDRILAEVEFRRGMILPLSTLTTALAHLTSPWPPGNAGDGYSPCVTPQRSGHLPINGLQLYYEVHGDVGGFERAPLLLIPGSFMSTDSMKQWVAAFVARRPVIVFDQQGHGRTADTPRTMSYEQFGDDAAALLHALEIERADVMGYSQGGGVALQAALRHPQLVSKLVVLSATYRQDGWYPSALQGLEVVSSDFFADTVVGAAFRQHSTDPEAFAAYIEKMKVLGIEDQNISDAQMRSIQAKTMVIVGDADAVKPEHALAMFKLRGGGDDEAAATGAISTVPQARLVILPATSHISISQAVPVLEPMITAFLDDVPPANPSLW